MQPIDNQVSLARSYLAGADEHLQAAQRVPETFGSTLEHQDNLRPHLEAAIRSLEAAAATLEPYVRKKG